MYHAVGDPADDPYQVTVSPGRLAQQLRWLARRGLTGVSMRELLAAQAQGRADRLVGLTFDDGYADFVEYAVPLLRQHGHTATVFVLPGRLGGSNAWDPLGPRRPLLDAAGIRAAQAAGMEIGSHGLLHRDLTAADDADLAAEAADSRRLLAGITGSAPRGFCYPYGALDARAVQAVRQAGYAYACAVDPGALAGPHALPRAYVGQADTALRLHAKRALHLLRHVRRHVVPPPRTGTDPAVEAAPQTAPGAPSGPRPGARDEVQPRARSGARAGRQPGTQPQPDAPGTPPRLAARPRTQPQPGVQPGSPSGAAPPPPTAAAPATPREDS